MKHLYMIGGTMGVGKTTVCRRLKEKLDNTVFLDGDWCWDMHPFIVNEETKTMVLENITFLLGQFLKSTVYEHIVFCWVMHKQEIIDGLLARLEKEDCVVHPISLICSPQTLSEQLQKDVDAGLRQPDIVQRSTSRLSFYEELNTEKICTDGLRPDEIADMIIDRTCADKKNG